MGILDIFRKDDGAIEALNNKVIQLEEHIAKENLNDSLAGIIGNNFITLTTDNVKNYFSKHPAVRGGVDMLGNMMSSLRLNLYQGDRLLEADAILKGGFDMQKPNPLMSWRELNYRATVYLYYRGEWVVYINMDNPRIALEPLNPQHLERKDGYWKYGKIKIPEEQLLYVPMFDPDGKRGISSLEPVKTDIINDLAAVEYQNKFFDNYGQLGLRLIDKLGMASKEDMKVLVDQINLAHQGTGKAYKTLGMPKGIEVDQDVQTMREMQMLEGRKDITERILNALQIPEAAFGIGENANRSIVETARLQIWSQNLLPRAMSIQEELNQRFFKVYHPGYHCEFDFTRVEELKEGMESRLLQAEGYKKLGYTTNEINDLLELNMEEIDDVVGDMRLIPSGMVPAENLLFEDDPVPPPAKAVDKIVDIIHSDKSIEKSKRRYIGRANRVQGKSETKMTKTLRRYFSKELAKVLKILRKENKAIDLNTTLAAIQTFIAAQKTVLADLMKPDYQDGSVAADGLALGALGQDVATAKYSAVVVESMTNKIQGINNHTYKLVRDQVVAGAAAGETINQIAKRITGVYKFNASRSRIIARTESAGLVNRTTDERYRSNNVKKKEWVDAGDADVRETHSSNTSVGVVLYDHVYTNGQKFPNDGNGGASENVNCRCVHVPVIG